ncbi:MAG: hypothetical protein RQM95_01240 [Syntrophaceticus schinkii]
MSDEGYKRLKKQLEKALAECASLRKENASLRALLCESSREDHLEKDNIMFVEHTNVAGMSNVVTNGSTPSEKVALFRSLFRGREDVYAVRWEEEVVGQAMLRLVVTSGQSLFAEKTGD